MKPSVAEHTADFYNWTSSVTATIITTIATAPFQGDLDHI